jgi:CubicO group peptidase (beta-lactamase class C family)
LKFKPGEGWYYGGGTEFAGVVVERVMGRGLDVVMQQEVFGRLGMNDTTFYREKEGFKGRVVGCLTRGGDGELSEVEVPVPKEPELLSLGSGLYMTALDHARVLQELLKSSAGDGELLKKEMFDEMFRPQLDDRQRAILKAITDMFHQRMVPEFPEGMPLDHGISGIINMDDVPGKRKKGSMMWHGMANGHWVS